VSSGVRRIKKQRFEITMSHGTNQLSSADLVAEFGHGKPGKGRTLAPAAGG
jgi:hypothetical protein